MTIKEQINSDFMEAYKAKDMMKKNFLSVLKGNIQTQEGKNIESTDENVLKLVKSLEKGILENIESRKKTGLDISEQELEITYLKPYLPTLISEEEVRTLVKDVLIRVDNKNLGFIMGTFMKENKGKNFDAQLVHNIIKEEVV